MNISGQEFIQAMSAIGAGIAMIAGVGPGCCRDNRSLWFRRSYYLNVRSAIQGLIKNGILYS